MELVQVELVAVVIDVPIWLAVKLVTVVLVDHIISNVVAADVVTFLFHVRLMSGKGKGGNK